MILGECSLERPMEGDEDGQMEAEHEKKVELLRGGLESRVSSSSDGDERPRLSNEEEAPPTHKIFVGGLSWETDEESMRKYFSRFGKVSSCVIMRDRHTKHPRGFGFVSYENAESADLVATQKHVLDGRQVEAKPAVPRSDISSSPTSPRSPKAQKKKSKPEESSVLQSAPEEGSASTREAPVNPGSSQLAKKLFVGGLPSTCRSEELRSHFSTYGTVTDAQVLIDHKTGNSRGFGFVTFANESSVDTVMGSSESSSHQEILGKTVEVKKAEPKQALDAKRSKDVVAGAGKPYPAMNYNGMGLLPFPPFVPAHYGGFYSGWPPYPVSNHMSSSVTYFLPNPAMEYNPSAAPMEQMYGPNAQSHLPFRSPSEQPSVVNTAAKPADEEKQQRKDSSQPPSKQ